jgi:hypothetical protein
MGRTSRHANLQAVDGEKGKALIDKLDREFQRHS